MYPHTAVLLGFLGVPAILALTISVPIMISHEQTQETERLALQKGFSPLEIECAKDHSTSGNEDDHFCYRYLVLMERYLDSVIEVRYGLENIFAYPIRSRPL